MNAETVQAIWALPWLLGVALFAHRAFRRMRPCRAPAIRKGSRLGAPGLALDSTAIVRVMSRASGITMPEERSNHR